MDIVFFIEPLSSKIVTKDIIILGGGSAIAQVIPLQSPRKRILDLGKQHRSLVLFSHTVLNLARINITDLSLPPNLFLCLL